MIRRPLSIVFLASTTLLYGGNTGKIAGTVVDKETGEPLIGANVMVEGTHLGGATDADGNYFILQVPPGTYRITASYIGYHNVTVKNVEVYVDLTTRINVEMESEAIPFPTIELLAQEPLVHPDITSTRRITSRQEIDATPGIEQTTDVFRLQGGTVVDAAPQTVPLGDGTALQVRDESLKNIHIRGGRGGEILYMVDGLPVTHPIYGGRDVLELNVVDIEAMELLTGAFSAEYGQAQSGVVNITTRSGGNRFKAGLEYKLDQFRWLGESYDTRYLSFYSGGPEPVTARILPLFGIKPPGRISYFVSGNANMTNTPYDNHRTRESIDLGVTSLTEKQDNTGNFNAKVDWRITNQFNITLSYHGSWKRWSRFDWLWKNYPDHTAVYRRNNQNTSLKISHTLSKSTFYTVNFGLLVVDYNASLDGRSPPSFWVLYKDGTPYSYRDFVRSFSEPPDSIESTIEAPQIDLTGFFDSHGSENIWRDDLTRTATFKGDIASQIHTSHFIKSGVEIQYHDLQYIDIQDGGIRLSAYGRYRFQGGPPFSPPPGPYKEFGQNRWVFHAYPVVGGAYVQDKFERESLIINAGARLDWFIPGQTVMDKEWKRAWEKATGLKSDWPWIKYKVSPRFGISFPISLETVVFFSYGHFVQLPELQFYYRDPWTGGFTGNPHLDFEQTILYEFGLTRQLAENWALDIKSYTKDISQQVGTTRLQAALGLPVELHENKGYGRARGVEFELRKRHANFSSGKATFTVQWANGYSSSAFEDYIRSLNDFPNPIRERRLNWDVRTQLVLQYILASPRNSHMNLLGVRLPDNWNITLLSRMSSGQPYTPGTLDPVERQKKENSLTGPVTMTSDLKIAKSFQTGRFRMTLFADIFNLFDQNNVQMPYGFNPWTGKPYRYGDNVLNTPQFYDWYNMFRLMDPRQFSTGRYTKLGLRVDL
ncbi:MAG: TonB-dependent receptor [Fidelibacterota bacterium]